MDDTIIIATSRKKCLQKLEILLNYCNRSGMVLNNSKTKFMVICGKNEDKKRLIVNNVVIENCAHYTYLGSMFTQDGSVFSSIKKHVQLKQTCIIKFISFISKNIEFPFWVKKKVFDACITSSLLYSSESWINNSYKAAESSYMLCIKTLLSVRKTAPSLLCLAELDFSSIEAKFKL